MWRIRLWLKYTLPRLFRQFFGWIGRGFKPEPQLVFNNVREFCEHLETWPEGEIDLKRVEERTSHRVYKYTACGAWLKFVCEADEDIERVRKTFRAILSQEDSPLHILSVCEVDGARIVKQIDESEMPVELKEYLMLKPATGFEFGFRPLSGYRIEGLIPDVPHDGEKWTLVTPDKVIIEFGVWVNKTTLLQNQKPLHGVYGIKVGSIVEGADACADADPLYFPFTEEQYDALVQVIEEECDRIWKETHGCSHCWTGTECNREMKDDRCNAKDQANDGSCDPDCKACDGDGVMI
jgi:hypothetical protein